MLPKIASMHKAAAVRHRPAAAFDIQIVLELVLLFFEVLEGLRDLFGINFGGGD